MGDLARTVLISGYYGFNNSGDEAVLHAIVTALREEAAAAGETVRIAVLSGAPEETARVHGVEAVHRMRPLAVLGAILRADALVSGGGSLLQDVTSSKSMLYYLAVIRLAKLLRRPVFIYAQGIGPIRDAGRFGPMIRSAFASSRYVSVRDAESKSLLTGFGLPAERVDVVPDPVMGLGSTLDGVMEPEVEPGALRLGVSVRYWRDDRRELDAIADALARVCEARPAVRIAFLPFHLPADREASLYVAEKLAGDGVDASRYKVHGGTEHPREMLREVAACDALIGMRLHSLIYAATAGVSPIGVSYDPKIDQFLRRLGEAAAGSTDDLDASKLAAAVMERLDLGNDAWYKQNQTKIEEMQQNSRKPAQQLIAAMRI
ncbi:polysaccharide pyruvyl transferase CsaB [Paenibacillus sp. TRM 82003]|nr:polysaccharide pyruvyl transferase CsaB [Paenibacillus sp. TRM 82003]MCI3923434.1 polysaccharide pyruvyl transferase CsaB [Paenibacillus sp. TRM 82003]